MIKKQIIFSSYDDIKNPFYAGGGARSIHNVAGKLLANYRVTVLTGKYPGSKNGKIDGVSYERVGIYFGGPKISQLLFQLSLPFYVLTKKFDLWIESFTPPFSTTILPVFTRKPVIGLVHMLSAEDMQRKYKLPFGLIENFGLKFYRYFIVLNEETRSKIMKINPTARFFVIPNGVDRKPVSGKIKNSKPYILFMGRIEVNQKGMDLLLKAYKKVRKNMNVPLVIAGTGEEKELSKLKALVKELKLEKDVRLMGRLNGSDWSETYSNATVVVISSRYETYPMVALEALSFGVPLVGFDIPGLKWIPDNAILKTGCFNHTKLSENIIRVLKNKKQREKMINSGKKLLRSHSWDTIVRSYSEAINTVLN